MARVIGKRVRDTTSISNGTWVVAMEEEAMDAK